MYYRIIDFCHNVDSPSYSIRAANCCNWCDARGWIRVSVFVITDGMSEGMLYMTRTRKINCLSAPPLRAMCDYSSGLAAIVNVSWDFLDKLLSFITLGFDLGWLFALVPVPQEDKSVWEWLECINTTKLHWAHSRCLDSAAGTCLSELIKTHRRTKKVASL